VLAAVFERFDPDKQLEFATLTGGEPEAPDLKEVRALRHH